MLAIMTVLSVSVYAQKKPVDYVNPFIGASTSAEKAGINHGLGKTFPGATTPFGMVQVSPNTITGGDNGSGYSYEHTSIEGFALTQMSGIGWNGDLGNFLVMPTTGPLKTSPGRLDHVSEGYRSVYSKDDEKASAGYYAVTLSDYKIRAEMTATPHSGMMRFTFPENRLSRIQIDLARRVGGTASLENVKVVNENTIQGWMKCTPDGGGWGNGDGKANYTCYFYAQFSKPLKNYGVWSADIPDDWKRKEENIESDVYRKCVAQSKIIRNITEKEGKHLGFFTEFETKKNEQVIMRCGISFVSENGAKLNLEKEITSWDFDKVHQQARDLWSQALGKIKIEGDDDEQKTVFYTALYHTMIDPMAFQDVDGQYPGGDGQPHAAKGFTKRTVFSGWDVFRSQFPLQTLINREVVSDMLNSLISLASENGKKYFERWELLNAYSGCMIGNPAISVLTDAYVKGIRNYDLNKAYQYAVNSSERSGNGDRGYAIISDPINSDSKGYAIGDFSISNTLEFAYTEWCLSRLSSLTGHQDNAVKYAKRSQSYVNVFDKEKNWFRPKKADGSWEDWPAEGRLKQFYGTVESNPYQQGWFVPHDVSGMVALMGGKEKVIADLTVFFEKTPEDMMWNDYYNHSNEPVHHVPFLFNRLGEPWLTQKWTREICRRAYHNSVEGLVGNEDVGQMSAWYVLAASGIHQVCPGDTRYEITSPVFDKIEFNLSPVKTKHNTFTIISKNNSKDNVYIQSAKLNGKTYHKCFIDYSAIAAGGVLELVMGNVPNKSWGAEN
jgi:predicted alpha-1,2-mannosidase